MKVTSTKDKELQYIHALVHGDSGVGKTTSLRTLPEDRTAIVLRERGTLPLRARDYAVLCIEEWEDVPQIIGMFMQPQTRERPSEIKDRKITVLAVDSLSELSELCKRHIVEVDRKRLTTDRTKGKRDTPPGIYDEQLTMEDWGLYRTRMLNLISAICHLPLHTICTSLSAWTEDKVRGGVLRTPNLSGKAAQECAAYFDLVLHMESIDEPGENGPTNKRVWRTFNDGRTIAKDASGVLEPFEDANWTKVFKKILGNNRKGGGK